MKKSKWLLLSASAAAAGAAAAHVLRRPFWGKGPGREDRLAYAARAVNYDGRRFLNPAVWNLKGVETDVPLSRKPQRPRHLLPTVKPNFAETGEAAVTWFGHSTLLVQMHGKNILIDPVFSRRCAPLPLRSLVRFSRPAVRPGELPHIDLLLLTHDHYDHMDRDSLLRLKGKVGAFVVPLGLEKHLQSWGVEKGRIHAMSWWEERDFDGLTVCCTPCRHNGGRTLSDPQRTLCCSWVLRDGHTQIFESGDTGYGAHFAAIHDRYGDFDLAMLDCAQYSMDWHYCHMFPEESIRAARALGAKTVIPIHWGAFVLSRHAWDDPPERFVRAAAAEGIPCVTPRLGERMELSQSGKYTRRWWRGME